MSLNYSKKSNKSVDAIRRLLNTRYVIRAKNQKSFQNIVDYQNFLENHFDAAGAKLILNETLGVAYLESNSDDDASSEVSRFGRVQTLTAIETFALILIRQQRMDYYTNPEENENPLLDEEKLKDAISAVSITKNDREFQKRYSELIDKLVSLQFLYGPDEGPKFISPVVDVCMPGDDVTQLRQAAMKYFSMKKENRDE